MSAQTCLQKAILVRPHGLHFGGQSMFQIYNVLLKNPTSELDNPVYFFEHIIIINNNNTLRRMEVFTLVFGKKSSFFLYSWCICQTQKFYHAWEKISNICEAIHSVG